MRCLLFMSRSSEYSGGKLLRREGVLNSERKEQGDPVRLAVTSLKEYVAGSGKALFSSPVVVIV
jgi:hypothetical protein